MIEPIREWLGPWALAVEQHHENFDGTGYPFGLAGSDISLGARIVSVADAFEVMTAVRSYKGSVSPSDARKELTRCAGAQFDPAIVRAFLNVSIGEQRWIIGPMALLFDVPIISQVGNLGNVLVATSQVALVAGSVAVAAVASGGNATIHPPTPSPAQAVTASVSSEIIGVDVSSPRIQVMGSVRATAEITNVPTNKSASVTYFVYDNRTCSTPNGGRVATLGPVTTHDGNVPSSPSWTATSAGNFYFVAQYSDQSGGNPVSSACDAGPVRVMAKEPTIATQLSADSIAMGGSLSDSAALVGSTANASGSETLYVYDNDACSSSNSGLVATLGPVSVVNGNVSKLPDWTAGAPGTYYVVVSYSGDANNVKASSGCASDPVVVTPGTPPPATPPATPPAPPVSSPPPSIPPPSTPPPTVPPPPTPPPAPPVPTPPPPSPSSPTITAQLSTSSAAIGATVHADATLSGSTASAGGTVTYDVYSNDTCASGGLVSTLGPVTVSGAVVPSSPTWTTTSAGTFYFVASYSGDANNTAASSDCAANPLTVNLTSPTITAQLSTSSAAIGATVHADATLSGSTASAGGTVTYDVYSNDTCASGGLVSTLGPVTVSGAVVPSSPTWTTTSAGTFYFVASYSGDANNTAASSDCAANPLTVDLTSPTITAQLSTSSAAIGATVHADATLSGSTASAGGTVTYDVYSNDTCASGGLVSTLGPVTVSGAVVPSSPTWTTTSAGTFYFVASYSGDANNTAASSDCAANPLTVTSAPSIVVDLSSGTIAVGQTVDMNATLTGVTASAGGTVTFNYYDNDTLFGKRNICRSGERVQRCYFWPTDTDGPVTRGYLRRGDLQR